MVRVELSLVRCLSLNYEFKYLLAGLGIGCPMKPVKIPLKKKKKNAIIPRKFQKNSLKMRFTLMILILIKVHGGTHK